MHNQFVRECVRNSHHFHPLVFLIIVLVFGLGWLVGRGHHHDSV